MIKTIFDKETQKIWNEKFSSKHQAIARSAMIKLQMLDAATCLNDLRIPPSNHLETLKNDRMGQHSIRINNQWRLCFEFKDGDAYRVEITDYH